MPPLQKRTLLVVSCLEKSSSSLEIKPCDLSGHCTICGKNCQDKISSLLSALYIIYSRAPFHDLHIRMSTARPFSEECLYWFLLQYPAAGPMPMPGQGPSGYGPPGTAPYMPTGPPQPGTKDSILTNDLAQTYWPTSNIFIMYIK